MHCSDLERYLEAILDGRLGRSRAALLRRHLSSCRACGVRVDHLRRFERDLKMRFRSMSREPSLWADIETDMVASSTSRALKEPAEKVTDSKARASAGDLPRRPTTAPVTPAPAAPKALLAAVPQSEQPAPRPRRLLGQLGLPVLAIVVLGALLMGGAEQIGLLRHVPAVDDSWRAYAVGSRAPALLTADGRLLRHWLVARLGSDLPPVPTADGLELVGGDVLTGGQGDVALAAYRGADKPVLVFFRPELGDEKWAALGQLVDGAGLNRASWQSGGFDYLAVGSVPQDKLELLSR